MQGDNQKNTSRFRDELSSIAGPADRVLRANRQRSSRAAALPRAVALVAVVPVLYLLLCLVLRSAGMDFGLSLWVVGPLSLVLPALYLFGAGRGAPDVSQASALAHIDDSLELKDRLSAAHEFLDTAEPSPFMLAAIADARGHADRARNFQATPQAVTPKVGVRHLVWPAVAVLALLGSGWIDVRSSVDHDPDVSREQAKNMDEVADDSTTPDTDRPTKTDPKRSRKPDTQSDPNAEDHKRGDSGVMSKNRKKSRGDEGSGKSSQAQSSSGRSTGEGQATEQAQPTKGAKKKPAKPKKEKPPKDRPRKKNKKLPQNQKDSVASAGQGKGKGSSRSPTASEWSSKDQSVADDEEELEDEDEVDDEDEESEARGGLQPSLRQRKPPVNRDLNIGFGGGKPPPHANGRGGPGMPKKQRGVAQLVLGIPYPDQIVGQPNPGRTKVTQERIEPQAQTAEQVAAMSRQPRTSPMGHLSRPVLLPWMQDLIRGFQISIHQASQEPTRGERVR